LDQGTSSSRAIVFDHAAKIHSMAQRDVTQIYPLTGWVEHNPNEIWRSQLAVLKEALINGNLAISSIAAIGITNQRETTLVWDRRTGEPVYNAIVWQDRRTANACDKLREQGLGRFIKDKTGLVVDPYFSATKIQWILDNISGARQNAESGHLLFGTVDTWLLWKLTNGRVHLTDPTNASRTMLSDISRAEWDSELLDLFNIPRCMLPEIVGSSHICAHTDKALLGEAIPIAGIAGDQQSALLGQSCLEQGMVKATYGTGCFVLMHTGNEPVPSNQNLLTTPVCKVDTASGYALEGSVFMGGAVIQWIRDGLGLIDNVSEVEQLAGQEADSGGVYLVPGFVGLGAPHWDPHATGMIIGMSRSTNGAHIARAALDCIAHQTADVLEAIRADSGIHFSEVRVDGGAASNNLLMQIQANLLQVPVVRPNTEETTALGTAYLAGLAVEYWDSPTEVVNLWQMDRRFEPQMDFSQALALRAEWHRAIERSRGWNEPGLI